MKRLYVMHFICMIKIGITEAHTTVTLSLHIFMYEIEAFGYIFNILDIEIS